MARPNDTSPEAEQVLREAYRRMPFARKWRLMGEMYHTAKVLHAAGFRQRNPGATDEAIHEAWMVAMLGERRGVSPPVPARSGRRGMAPNDESSGSAAHLGVPDLLHRARQESAT